MININNDNMVAYFSMEIALENGIKTFSGGLGVLAGDILRSAADLKFPMIGVTLLSDQGYFDQKISDDGEQISLAAQNYNFSPLKKLDEIVTIFIDNTAVEVAVWQYEIRGIDGFIVPVFLLDTNRQNNDDKFRDLTGRLYGHDKEYRLLQEIILGRGGYQILKKLGYNIDKYHINEGHGAFVAVEEYLSTSKEDISLLKTRAKIVFTTHTPIKMAQDIFSKKLVSKYFPDFPFTLPDLLEDSKINMTKVALYFSSYINGVALSHQKVSSEMFPDYPIHNITNGVHSTTWTSSYFANLFDKYISNWRISSESLRDALIIPLNEIWLAHQKAKSELLNLINDRKNIVFSEEVFTIGFARRFTSYKRPGLLLSNISRLLEINSVNKIQIIFAGKAHPADEKGQREIKNVHEIIKKYPLLKIVFLEEYDLNLAKNIISGVDLWLNTPLPPNEASGTSGMKAAHNGVPQLSTYDGWWREGYIEDKTGWTINSDKALANQSDKKDADSMYELLENKILPIYYNNPIKWQEIMRYCISLNASFFNTDRVLKEYIQDAYQNRLIINYDKNYAKKNQPKS